jgi:glycosyltransferase involved in cell wall biosynthesis
MSHIFFLLFILCGIVNIFCQQIDTFKTFEIVIPSFNNAAWAEKNLRSVCFQKYPRDKYHITYINDASTDGTGKIVADFISQHKLQKYVTLINNKTRKGQLENRYRAFHNLPDSTIVAECDGDDFYANDNVLNELNKIYQDDNVWMLYTTIHKTFPNNVTIRAHAFTHDEIERHSFRNFFKRPTFQLRSYYAWLFKQIKLKDLLYGGKFYPVLTDPAYMIPMLEMAGLHNKYVHKILYIRNTSNPLGVAKRWDTAFRKKVYDYISSQEPYQLIEGSHQKITARKTLNSEIVICCSSELSAKKIVAEVQKKAAGCSRCTVFVGLGDQPYVEGQKPFGTDLDVTFKIYDPKKLSLKTLLIQYLKQSSYNYIVFFAGDDVHLTNKINIKKCMELLDECYAQIFFLKFKVPLLSSEVPCVEVKSGTWAYQFGFHALLNKDDNCFEQMICRKQFLLQILNEINFTDTHDFSRCCAFGLLQPEQVGLFFEPASY